MIVFGTYFFPSFFPSLQRFTEEKYWYFLEFRLIHKQPFNLVTYRFLKVLHTKHPSHALSYCYQPLNNSKTILSKTMLILRMVQFSTMEFVQPIL